MSSANLRGAPPDPSLRPLRSSRHGACALSRRGSLAVAVMGLLALVAGCDRRAGDNPPYPNYARCETSADCDELLPDCRRVFLEAEDREVSFCTRDCTGDGECPNEGTSLFVLEGHCVGLDGEGRLDAEADGDRICVPDGECEVVGAKCALPGEAERLGRCVRYGEDPSEAYFRSITCLHAPPLYNRCDSDGDCSVDSPRCRALHLDEATPPVKVCVRTCATEQDASCRFLPTDPLGAPGQCLGINEKGEPDHEADEILCLPGCFGTGDLISPWCEVGGGASGSRRGGCELVEYHPDLEPIPVCVEGKVEDTEEEY